MATLPKSKKAMVLKEGMLQKRQRGKHVKGQNFSGLRFQSRFVSLNKEYLHYYRNSQDKKPRGQFPVSSIAFVEECTFGEIKYGFQIGNVSHDEVMYFGAPSDKDRIKWMEAIRMGARMLNNKMANHYHPGAFGILKDPQGQWSCCRRERTAQGCSETATAKSHERSQSLYLPTNDDYGGSYYDDEDSAFTESLPTSLTDDTASLDSGYPDIYGSKDSLLSGTQGKRREFDEDHEISKMLARHEYNLLFTSDYGTALNALDFRGTDIMVAGGGNGSLRVLDVIKQMNVLIETDYSEITSVETWRSLLLIGTKSGVWLRDLDDMKINYQLESLPNDVLESITVDTIVSDTLLPTSGEEYFAAFSPDGSRLITANQNILVVQMLKHQKPEILHSKKLPGNTLLLSVSPDSKLPMVVIGVVKNKNLVLCLWNYMENEGNSEVDIGAYNSSHVVRAHFLPLQTKLAVGHGKTLTLVKIAAPGQLTPENLIFNTEKEITSLQYSPIGDELVLGMSDGNVAILDGRANEFSVRHTLEFSSQSSTPVTSITFSKDCSLLALGHKDGRLNVVERLYVTKRKKEATEHSRYQIVPAGGYTLNLEEHGITIVFPNGFTTQPSVKFEYSVSTLEHHHIFPSGVHPVSVILSLTPAVMTTLR